MPLPYSLNPLGISAAAWTRLQYLESSGTQYILVAETITQDSQIEVAFQGAGTIAGNTPLVYGCRTSNGAPRLWAGKGSGGNWNIFLNYGNSTQTIATLTQSSYNDLRHVLGNSGNVGYLDDNSIAFPATNFSFGQLCLFGADNPGGPNPAFLGKTKIYEAKINSMHLLPYLDPSGVPCLRDKASGAAYYNSGTGQFSYA